MDEERRNRFNEPNDICFTSNKKGHISRYCPRFQYSEKYDYQHRRSTEIQRATHVASVQDENRRIENRANTRARIVKFRPLRAKKNPA